MTRSRRWRPRLWMGIALAVSACSASPTATAPAASVGVETTSTTSAPATSAATTPPPPSGKLKVEVISKRPHDATAFTQGLEFVGSKLYESAGLYGKSQLREIDPKTGAALRKVDIAKEYFAEGLTEVDGKLLQLTWKEQRAFIYSTATFEKVGELRYDTEGWGLCDNGTDLIMSDGTANLYVRDRATLATKRKVPVFYNDTAVTNINELECVGGVVYANIWQTNNIYVIDPATGKVVAEIDASGLLSAEELRSADVLNGIAHDPATGNFLITGKLWPAMFEVRFVAR